MSDLVVIAKTMLSVPVRSSNLAELQGDSPDEVQTHIFSVKTWTAAVNLSEPFLVCFFLW